MKKLTFSLSIASFLVGLALLASPYAALASSGPTGVNEVRTEPGPEAGQVTINWRRFHLDVDNYSISYGTAPGKYQYGASKIGNIVSFTVGSLTPGTRYYFRLYPFRGGQLADPASPEFSEVAATSPRTIVGTAGPYGRNLLTATSGPKSGEVKLMWKRFFPETETFHIVYGIKSGQYLYGALNARDASPGDNTYDFTVGGLTPGVRYYFALMPQIGGTPIYTSAEVSQVAKR